MKHEAAVRNIGQLKNEIDALRAELRDKKLEIGDLESDSSALKQQLDEKNIELENHKNDFKGCMADSEELGAEREGLSNAASKLRGIIGQIQEEDQLLKEDNDSVGKRLDDLEKYQGQLVLQERILREKIQGYENENNELDASINELCDGLSELEVAVKKAQDELLDLQQQTSEVGLLNEKYKTENQHVQRSTQAEILKNNNLAKSLKSAEYTSKVRGGQIEEADREVSALKEEKDSLGHINEKLGEDLEACRVHLENLGLINTKVRQSLRSSWNTCRTSPPRTSPCATSSTASPGSSSAAAGSARRRRTPFPSSPTSSAQRRGRAAAAAASTADILCLITTEMLGQATYNSLFLH